MTSHHVFRKRAGRVGGPAPRHYGWWVLRSATAAALVIDAIVHIRTHTSTTSAGTAQRGRPVPHPGGGGTCRGVARAGVPRRASWMLAFVVAASAVGAALLFTYVDVGPLAGLPNLYEPSWAPPGKALSATAEAIGALLALAGLVFSRSGWFARAGDAH